MHIAKCCKCDRLFPHLGDMLYTHAICASCLLEEEGVRVRVNSGETDGVLGVMAVIEQNLGGIDNGELGSRMFEWYDSEEQ